MGGKGEGRLPLFTSCKLHEERGIMLVYLLTIVPTFLLMQNQRGFIGVGLLIAIILGIAVLGGGAYYVMQQQAPTQTASENFDNVQALPTTNNQQTQTTTNTPVQTTPTQNPATVGGKITITFPAKGDILRTGSIYTVKWTGQSNSDQTLVALKAIDPMCWNVGLVAEGERGCSAIELAKVKLADGSFQLDLNSGMSPLSQLSNRDNKASHILFFDTPTGRVTSQAFTISGNDFSISESYHGKDLYAPGETINFSVGGRTDTGEVLSPDLGFSAKVFLEWGDNWGPGGTAIYREGTYNASQGRWDFTTTAPMTRKNDYDYRIFVYVKCSDVNKCAARYPNLLEKDLIIRFNVSSN